MNASHRGGFGPGPTQANRFGIAKVADVVRRGDGTSGGVASKAPKHVEAARVRLTEAHDSPWCPPWVRKLVAGGASVDDVVQAAVKRAQEHATKDGLVEVETLLNELSRDPRHTSIVRKAVSRVTVGQALKKGATP